MRANILFIVQIAVKIVKMYGTRDLKFYFLKILSSEILLWSVRLAH